jgi:hypothetical protein
MIRSEFFLKQASFMKRFLVFALAMAGVSGAAFAYDNSATVQVPPMDPSLVQIDAGNSGNVFVNEPGALFSVSEDFLPLKMSNVQNFTNHGIMTGNPGFIFEYFGNPPPPNDGGGWTPSGGKMAENFVNQANGVNGGIIDCSGFFGGAIVSPGFFLLAADESLGGKCIISATNIVHSGEINMDASGLIKLTGDTVDLTAGSLTMATPGQLFFVDTNGVLTTVGQGNAGILDGYWGVGQQTTNNLINPSQYNNFPPVISPFHLVTTRQFQNLGLQAIAQLFLPNAQAFVSDVQTDVSNRFIQVVFLQQTNAAISNSVFFVPGVETAVQWQWQSIDFATKAVTTNYLYLTDDFGEVTNLQIFPNGFAGPNTTFIPGNYTFIQGAPFLNGFLPPTPPSGSPLNLFTTFAETNAWSAYQAIFTPAAQTLDDVVGENVTNLAGRIEITANKTLDLTRTRISALAYTLLSATNHFIGNSNAVILSPNMDIILRSTNGNLSISNLVVPNLTTPVGTCGLDSERWRNVDPVTGVTNHYHILFVDSEFVPLAPVFIQTLSLKATNAAAPGTESMFISDNLNVTSNLLVDTVSLTITSNTLAAGAYSGIGELNLLSPYVFWSSSMPRLLNLTNFGHISAQNLINFAGNMTTPDSARATATPYNAFVNHGNITDQGTFIFANYFENGGIIQGNPFGSIDVRTGDAINTNATLSAPNGNVTFAVNNLMISNSFVQAGGSIILTPQCSLSDGYVFGNQFGLITNSTLPNVVTNGNDWIVGAGVQIPVKPPTADLLGTTISNVAQNFDSFIQWSGKDAGRVPDGFADNLAVGRLILDGTNPSRKFNFVGASANNAIYVDSLEFRDFTTNTDANGNFPSISIAPGMKVYYAQALMNGVSIAEKLNGKNGGGFEWVSNYAGVYSSTNMFYPSDGNTHIFNEALAISPDIDSDNDGTVNRDDVEPIPAGLTFPITITGPLPCSSGNGGGTGNGGVGGNGAPAGAQSGPGTLAFPGHSSGTSALSFSVAQGTYDGLFYETNVTPASSGFFTARVTGRGAFTAKLELSGHTYTFSGSFDTSGNASGSVKGRSLPTLTMALQLVNNDQITGEISGDGWSAQLLAQKAAFGSRNPVPAEWVGKDSVLLAMDTNSTAAAGDSFGSVTVSKSGAVQWTATLPDGSKVTQKSALSKDGVWPLYSAPYGGSGSFIGWMQMTNGDSDMGGSAVWIVPPGKCQLYLDGLTNDLNATGSSVTGLIGALARSKAILSGGNLVTPLTNSVTIIGKTGLSGNNNTLKLSVNLKNGSFNGSVFDSGTSQTLSFQGALLEKSGVGGGFFLNANKDQGGKVYLAPAN